MKEIETYQVILSIAGFMIVALLSIIAYFLKEFNHQVNELKKVVVSLQIAISSEKAITKGWKENFSEKHLIFDKRLDDHGRRLDKHEVEIATIRTRLK